MNPWDLFLAILGWIAVGALVALIVIVVIGVVVAVADATRSKKSGKRTTIFTSRKEDG